MAEYLSPGVYVEEIDAGPKPIEGVSTSTTGAVGVTMFGPTEGKPMLVTSFAEFARRFGGYMQTPDAAVRSKWEDLKGEGGYWWQFPLSVKGFFDNGGQRMYVKRVVASTSVASKAVFGKGLVSNIAQDTASGVTKIKLTHLIGIATAVANPVVNTITLFNGDNGQQIGGNFTVTAYNAVTGEVTVDAAVPAALLAKRGDFAQIQARSNAAVPAGEITLTFTAKSQGEWGDDVWVRTRPAVSATLNIMANATLANNAASATTTTAPSANTAGPPPETLVTVASAAGLANGDTILVNGKQFAISALDAAAKTFKITPALPPAVIWPAATAIKRIRKANDNAAAAPTLNIWGASVLYANAIVELDNGLEKDVLIVDHTDGDVVTFKANVTKNYLEGQKARLIEAMVDVSLEPAGQPATDETFGPLRLFNDGSVQFLASHVKDRSALVNVTVGAGYDPINLTKFPSSPNGGWLQLSGGDDDFASLDPTDFIGADNGPGKRTGIAALEDIPEISICLAPGIWSPSVLSALIIHCETLRYRFAIVDPPDVTELDAIRSFREPIDTKYAAIYFPWLKLRDPLSKQETHLAPSGHLAGIYARVDVERGVHKAPANEVVRGVLGFAEDISKREQDILNPRNINAFRYFPGRGYRVWGARCLTSDSAWKYINVRRLFIFVEASIDNGTQWCVFEPNDETLWLRVRQSISNFLETVWRSGALMGTKAAEAFFVKCDRSTMSQDDIDNGRLICLIGIAPVKPAEFVIFRIQQKTMDATNP